MSHRPPGHGPDWKNKRPATYERDQVFLHFRQHRDVKPTAASQPTASSGGSPWFYCTKIEDCNGLFDRHGNPNEHEIRGRSAHLRQYQGSYGSAVVVRVRSDQVQGYEGAAIPKDEYLASGSGQEAHFHRGGHTEVVLHRDDLKQHCEVTTYDLRPVQSADGHQVPRDAAPVNTRLDQHGVQRDNRQQDMQRSPQVDRNDVGAIAPDKTPLSHYGTPGQDVQYGPPLRGGAESTENHTVIRTHTTQPDVVTKRTRSTATTPTPTPKPAPTAGRQPDTARQATDAKRQQTQGQAKSPQTDARQEAARRRTERQDKIRQRARDRKASEAERQRRESRQRRDKNRSANRARASERKQAVQRKKKTKKKGRRR